MLLLETLDYSATSRGPRHQCYFWRGLDFSATSRGLDFSTLPLTSLPPAGGALACVFTGKQQWQHCRDGAQPILRVTMNLPKTKPKIKFMSSETLQLTNICNHRIWDSSFQRSPMVYFARSGIRKNGDNNFELKVEDLKQTSASACQTCISGSWQQ